MSTFGGSLPAALAAPAMLKAGYRLLQTEAATVDTPLPRAFRQAGDVIVPVAAESRDRSGRGAGSAAVYTPGLAKVNVGLAPVSV